MIRCKIVPYDRHRIPGVREFNQRLKAGGSRFRFPQDPDARWFPRSGGKLPFEELFLAVDEGGVVRGGYGLKHQMFQVNGRLADVGMCQFPLSESVVDPRYKIISAMLFRDVTSRHPLLYALGIGGFDEPYGRSLLAMKWKLYKVPFFFMIFRTKQFLRNIQFLRTSSLRRAVLDATATSIFLGPLVVATHRGLGLASTVAPTMECEVVTDFGPWADDIWHSASSACSFAAVRDSSTLNREYPHQKPFFRLRFSRRGKAVGWVVLLATQMEDHNHFGSMYVGTIVDCMATPGNEMGMIRASVSYLKSLGVDMIISNQNHASWKSALIRTGFFQGPSNFIFGMSRQLEAELGPIANRLSEMHLNRGDGNGPIHL